MSGNIGDESSSAPHQDGLMGQWAAVQAANENSNHRSVSSSNTPMTTRDGSDGGTFGNGSTTKGGGGARKPPSPSPPTSSTSYSKPLPPPPGGTSSTHFPIRRPLPSYVSEPPSTLIALSVLAENENAASAAAASTTTTTSTSSHLPHPSLQQLGPSPFSQTQPQQQQQQQQLQQQKNNNNNNNSTGTVSGGTSAGAWMHRTPDTGDSAAATAATQSRYRAQAGDLAGFSDIRRRRRSSARSLSPTDDRRKTIAAASAAAAGLTTSPKGAAAPGLSSFFRINSLHRRDATAALFARDTQSDDEDNDDIISQIAGNPRKRGEQQLGSEFDFEVTEPVILPFYRQRYVWILVAWMMFSLGFVAAGVSLLVYDPEALTSGFQAWRLCFFIAGVPVIWYLCDFATKMIVWVVERSMFTVKNALYFTYTVRKPMRNWLRALLVLGWWALIMLVKFDNDAQSNAALGAIYFVLRVWACITLFMTANLLKTLIGKILALKFNKESHLAKMCATLKKEQWLHQLLEPRAVFNCDDDGDDDPDDGCGDGENLPTAASSSLSFKLSKLGRSRSSGTALSRDSPPQKRGITASRSLSGKLMFWRKNSAPLPRIKEEGSGGAVTGDHYEEDVEEDEHITIRIDKDIVSPTATSPTRGAAATLAPVRVGDTETNNSTPTAAAASPLPARAAIDAANAAAHTRRADHHHHHSSPFRQAHNPLYSTPAASVAATTTPRSATLHRGSGTGRSTDSRTTKAAATAAAAAAAAAGMTFFGSGPLKKDEMMTKLAKLERYIRKTELEVTFRDALNNSKTSTVTSEEEAKRVGLFLFWNVKSDFDREAIEEDDLRCFLSSSSESDVLGAFEMLDDDKDGRATVEDCVAAVQTILQERRNLAASLKDTRSIASSLENIVGTILHIIFFMIYLFILFSLSFSDVWAFVSTVILGLSFIFGSYIRTIFENAMFLFNTHPFDIGDMLYMDNDFLTVDEIQINFTVFMTSTNQRLWVPNQRLVTNPQGFVNLSTSGNRTEAIKILVDLDTPSSVLDDAVAAMEELKESMPLEIAAVGGAIRDATVPMKLTLVLWYEFTHQGTNLVRSGKTRSKIHICVSQALSRSGVTYTWPAMKMINLPSAKASSGGDGGGVGVVGGADPAAAATLAMAAMNDPAATASMVAP